jgi:hypothetical protein
VDHEELIATVSRLMGAEVPALPKACMVRSRHRCREQVHLDCTKTRVPNPSFLNLELRHDRYPNPRSNIRSRSSSGTQDITTTDEIYRDSAGPRRVGNPCVGFCCDAPTIRPDVALRPAKDCRTQRSRPELAMSSSRIRRPFSRTPRLKMAVAKSHPAPRFPRPASTMSSSRHAPRPRYLSGA